MEKLRKALEMAKKERMEEKALEVEKVSLSQEPSPSISGRISPVYKVSQAFEIVPEILVGNRCVCISSEAYEIEFYKILRTQVLQRTGPNGWNSIMITSALPGEGKTLTAINLALTFAREFNHTVLLVDCDLRQQQIHKTMGIPSKHGLIDALLDHRSLQEIIIWPGIEKLTLISGGRTIIESSELLNSPKMKSLVSEIKSRYPERYVFWDTPPILSAADAVAFSPLVDAILMVVQANRTSIQDIKKAIDLIPKEKFLGFVLNRNQVKVKPYTGSHYRRPS